MVFLAAFDSPHSAATALGAWTCGRVRATVPMLSRLRPPWPLGLFTSTKFYNTIRRGGAHDTENKPPGGAGRSAKGDTGTTGTAVGTWMGKGGGKGRQVGKRRRKVGKG